MNRLHGFTLIELLVVISIVLILISIALPNFLEARTRSCVARVQAEHKSLAVAIESYQTQFNRYPDYGNPSDYAQFAGEAVVFLPVRLTTPIAFLKTLPIDIFRGQRSGLSGQDTTYFYMNNYETLYLGKQQFAGHVREHYRSLTGETRRVEWTVWSFGPDLDDDHGTHWYSPTNGTRSNGDFIRFGP